MWAFGSLQYVYLFFWLKNCTSLKQWVSLSIIPLCALWKFQTLIFIICHICSIERQGHFSLKLMLMLKILVNRLLMKCVYPCDIWKGLFPACQTDAHRSSLCLIGMHWMSTYTIYKLQFICIPDSLFQYRLWCYTMRHPKIEVECTVISTVSSVDISAWGWTGL